LQIRADKLYHLGMPDPLILDFDAPSNSRKVIRYSPYLAVDHKHGEKPSAAVPVAVPGVPAVPAAVISAPTVTYLSLTRACAAVILCLNKEKGFLGFFLVHC